MGLGLGAFLGFRVWGGLEFSFSKACLKGVRVRVLGFKGLGSGVARLVGEGSRLQSLGSL